MTNEGGNYAGMTTAVVFVGAFQSCNYINKTRVDLKTLSSLQL